MFIFLSTYISKQYIGCYPWLTGVVFCGRPSAGLHVYRLRRRHPRPVHPAGLPGPGVARRLPPLRRVQPVPRRQLHLLRARRQDLLQAGLRQVGADIGGAYPRRHRFFSLLLSSHSCQETAWSKVFDVASEGSVNVKQVTECFQWKYSHRWKKTVMSISPTKSSCANLFKTYKTL